ncbi:MAG: hypothetical protein JO048_05150 [Methylobacteriaceae bacterium]|nr:hypothetical protein [Methylobacteriaceae bacterium]
MYQHLVQILLPLTDNEGRAFQPNLYEEVRAELVRRFGGLTAYTRSPAQGVWSGTGEVAHDDIIVLEVMCRDLDEAWWSACRRGLERLFRQESIIVRAQEVRLL